MKKETQQNEANNKPKIIVICISLKAYVAKKKKTSDLEPRLPNCSSLAIILGLPGETATS